VCLISALAIHGLTTQIPHEIHLAISRTARYPTLDIFLEAISVYRRRRGASLQLILEYSRTNRVDKLIRPYLEAST